MAIFTLSQKKVKDFGERLLLLGEWPISRDEYPFNSAKKPKQGVFEAYVTQENG